MGEAIDRLRALVEDEQTVALSLVSRVKAYTRTSSTGKQVHVDAYTRTLSKMSMMDLHIEYNRVKASKAPVDRNRLQQVLNEIRRRDPVEKSDG
jgi:hypothetical protein